MCCILFCYSGLCMKEQNYNSISSFSASNQFHCNIQGPLFADTTEDISDTMTSTTAANSHTSAQSASIMYHVTAKAATSPTLKIDKKVLTGVLTIVVNILALIVVCILYLGNVKEKISQESKNEQRIKQNKFFGMCKVQFN